MSNKKQYDYGELFSKLLTAVKQRDTSRKLDCLFLLEYIQVKIDNQIQSLRVVDVFKKFNVAIPASAIGYSKNGVIMLFSEKSQPQKTEKKKPKNVAEL